MSRSSLASAIQVKATPANKRFKDVLAVKQETSAGFLPEASDEVVPPSSIGHLVPSTGHRHGRRDALADSVSPATDLVSGTPARQSLQASFIRRMACDESTILPSSPLMSRTAALVDESPDPQTTGRVTAGVRPRSDEVMATPVRKSVSKLDLIQSAVSVQELNPQKKVSIYETLGWDDDFDDI